MASSMGNIGNAIPVGRPVNTGDEEYFRRMTLDAAFSRVWGVYTEYMPVFLKIAAAAMGLKILCVVVFALIAYETIAAFVANLMNGGDMSTFDMDDAMSAGYTFASMLIMYLLTVASINAASHGAMIRATCDVYARGHGAGGNPPNFFDCMTCGMRRIPNMVLAMILRVVIIAGSGVLLLWIAGKLGFSVFGIFLTVVLAYVVGTYLALSLAVYAPSLMVESNKNFATCLVRSWGLSQNNRLFLLAVLFLFWLGAVVIYIIIMVVLAKMGFSPIVGFVMSMLPELAFNPMFAILKTALYIHLRVFHEGLTGEQFRNDIDNQNNGGAGAGAADNIDIDGPTGQYSQVLLVEEHHHDDDNDDKKDDQNQQVIEENVI